MKTDKQVKTILMGLLLIASLTGVKAQAFNEPVLLIATVKVKPGAEEAFKNAAVKILAPTRAEEGSLSYSFNQSPQDPTEFATVEIWRSQADIDKHMKLSHIQTFFSEVGSLFAPGYPILKEYQQFEK